MKVSYALIAILFVNVLADLKDDYQKEYKLEISLSNMEIHRASNHYDSNENGLEYIITIFVKMVNEEYPTIGMMSYGLTTAFTIPEHINIKDLSLLKEKIAEQRYLRKKIYDLIVGPASEDPNQSGSVSEHSNQSRPDSEDSNQSDSSPEDPPQIFIDFDNANGSGPDFEYSNQSIPTPEIQIIVDYEDTNQNVTVSENPNQSVPVSEDPIQNMIKENAKIRYESQKTKNLTKLLENRRIGHTEELKNRIAHESTGIFLELRRLANERRPIIERALKNILARKLTPTVDEAGNAVPIYMSRTICLLIALWISSNTASKTPTKFDGDICIIGYKKYHFVKYRSIDGKLWQVNRLDVPIKELNVQLYEENFIYNILEEY